jgi:HEAT repeat protein
LVWARWPQLTQHLPSLVTSPHPEVRAVAGRALGPRAFELFWTNWPRLPAERRRAAGKALVKVAPQFGELLKARLTTQGLTDRMQGLAVVRELELGPDFAPEILGLAGGSDPVIASAAVGALASRSDPQAAERIAAHLDHADPRVRANAVEALDRMDDRGHLDRLTRMAQEEANRPRANAIRALIRARRTREALPALHEMLHHPLPQHRASALWVVQNLGLVELVRAVAELALTDPVAGVQGRAMDLVKQLAKQTQAKRATSIAGLDPAELAHAVAEGGG